jgi:uridine phosphorylase
LQSLSGVGQTTATNLGTTGAANAANVGNLITGGAAAQAAGQVGMANAFTGGLGTYLNYNQGNNLLNALQRNQNMQMVNTGGYSNTPAYMVQPPLGG